MLYELAMKAEKVLLVKGSSGFGNRIESLLTGILYARLSGRKLIVDWNDSLYSSDGTNSFFQFFECSLCDPAQTVAATDSVNPAIWRGHLHESSQSMRGRYGTPPFADLFFSADLARLDHEEDVLVMWLFAHKIDLLRPHFHGPFSQFSQMTNNEILRKLLQEDLVLHRDLRRRVDQFAGDFGGRPTVGVHARYTDHRIRLWSVLRQLEHLLQRHPDLQIFLATDNMQIKQMFERNYSNVITTPHWYSPTPGVPIHFSRSRPDAVESGREALVDLYLLAKCNYLIIDTSSSFSYVASLLTMAPPEHVVDVGSGKKRSRRVRDLIYKVMLGSKLYSWGPILLSKYLRLTRGVRS